MMQLFQLPLIEVFKPTDECEDDDTITALIRVQGSDNLIEYRGGYIDFWGDGGRTPQDVVVDIFSTLVEQAVERINEREAR